MDSAGPSATSSASLSAPRKKNFTMDEERVLLEEYATRKEYLTSAFNNKVTNNGKNIRWKEITDAVNALGHENRVPTEVKSKWKNMSSKAKATFHSFKKAQKQTGGGPPPKPPCDRVR